MSTRDDGNRIETRDDPRLTAYALGEVEPTEAAAVEDYLRRHPEIRSELQEVAALGDLLSASLGSGRDVALTDEQRQALLREVARPGAVPAATDRPAGEAGGPAAGGHRRQGAGGGRHAGTLSPGAGVLMTLRLWLPAAAALLLGVLAWQAGWFGDLGARVGPAPDRSGTAPGEVVQDASGLGEDARARQLEGEAGRRQGLATEQVIPRQFDADGRLAAGSPDEAREKGAANEPLGQDEAGTMGEAPRDKDEGEAVVAFGRAAGTGSRDVDPLEGELLAAGEPAGTPAARGRGALPGPAAPASPAARRLREAEALPAREAADEASGGVLEALGYLGDSEARDDGLRTRRQPRMAPPASGESYAPIVDNPFMAVGADPLSALSTFGIDVDSASYSNVRRFLNRAQVPPRDAVRLEELLNAFDYAYAPPTDEHPFAVHLEATAAPWAPTHRLVRIGLKGREVPLPERPPVNLVFLLDVSGSMASADKLPLLVASVKLLLQQLDERDRVALVTYAQGSQVVLPSTSCADNAPILAALDGLRAGGSTHASAGIELAYQVAAAGFQESGVNRVLLATDGDFNVGITGEGDLERLIADKARGGVFLTVLGFGTGNYKDSKAEILADRGNGHYAYVDSLDEAHRVLVREVSGTLITIAKDVKLQVEFNPAKVAGWRLLGYENRALAATDFRDDRKDAGEIGAGHTVTALYEVLPVGVEGLPGTADLRYRTTPPSAELLVESDELLTVNLRYKLPDEDLGRELAVSLVDEGGDWTTAGADTRFAAAVASFGMLLRESPYRGDTSFEQVAAWATEARGEDPEGARAEFVRLARVAQGLLGR